MAPRSVAIDIVEENIQNISPSLLRALLKDRTTNRNIVWATSDYFELYGEPFAQNHEITSKLITGNYWNVIQPRTAKLKERQNDRTKQRAEVFTPSWVCNVQNNLLDECWFGRKSVFNEEHDEAWVTYHEKISFPEEKTWKDYIDARRMEITCGEAPYLVSRYDTTTGERIKLDRRIGLLDRKFRVLNENAESDNEWLEWAYRALQSVYGYEFQGDNVLLARENILFTFIDNYSFRFKQKPDDSILKKAANIISWNIWQMDGKTYMPPFAPVTDIDDIPPLLKLCQNQENTPTRLAEQPRCCILMNWRGKKKVSYYELINDKEKG